MSLLLQLLLMLLACSSQATHFYGTVMTYDPKEMSANGSVVVNIRYKLNFHSCDDVDTWTCFSGNCGNESQVVLNVVYNESSGEWCQREGTMTRQVPSNAPFQLMFDGGSWIDDIVNGIVSWRAVTLVELRNRSDTGRANRSPQTSVLPAVRVPSNCPRDFNLLAYDPDGDEVKCRYGNATESECNPCTPPSVLNLSSSCSLSFSPTNSSNQGPYAVQLVMEDFPRQTITLTETDGTQSTITTKNSLSKIPVQFVLKVDPEVPSCTEGLYLPKFLPPTPANRAQLYIAFSYTLEIRISAQANFSTVSELLFSGPYNINQTTSGAGQFILRWTPSEDQDEESHPICFVVQAVNNSTKYHSELRCIVVNIRNDEQSSQATNFYGTVMTYDPKETSTNGSVVVNIHYKLNFHSCDDVDMWTCFSGNCGNESQVVLNVVYNESSGEWCQREGIMTRQVPSNAPFQLMFDGGNWIDDIVNGIVSWRAVTLVELRNRSDTGRANRSPQTSVLPAVRVPSNCPRDFNLLAYDPDGDEVKCRYGNATESECNPCTPPSVLNLSSSCSLSFSPTNSSNQGPYAVQLVMEDFPRQTITLTETDGTQSTITAKNSLSKIPVQFVLKVDPEVPSCTEGLYLPKFLPPTPANRAQLYIAFSYTLEIRISAQANFSTVSELLFSGPYNINQTTSGAGQFILRWTPSEGQDEESHPICFVVQAVNNSTKYHSELRCIVVNVRNDEQSSQATNFYGTVMTYDPKETSTNGSVVVNIRYKLNFHSCDDVDTWTCFSGNCGNESQEVLNVVYNESSGEWCQREGIMTRQVPSNAPFQLMFDGGSWIDDIVNGIVSWRAVTLVELRNRSDTGRANRSPQTSVLPAVRVPSNCPRDFNLLAYDPDGDEVKCRYGNATESECNPCTPPSVLNLSSSCSLSFSPTNSSNQGPYAVQLVMEDFPRQTITLTETDGTQSTITTKNSLSKIPVQFVLKVDPEVPSCTEGLYLPKFLPPTPANRAQLYIAFSYTLEIRISAQANFSTVSELLFSGPYNINQTTSGAGQFILRWTPSEDQDEESHPICFVVQAVNNSTKYHSELRCIVVNVVKGTVVAAETTPASSQIVIGLRLRISSSYPLSANNIKEVLQQLKDELVRRGLPSNIVLTLVSHMKLLIT